LDRMKPISAALWICAGAVALVPTVGCKKDNDAAAAEEKYEPPPRRATTLSSYVDLCEGREPFSGAKKYEKSSDAKAPSKVAMFRKYVDDKEPSYQLDQRATVGEVLAKEDETDKVELVACVELTRKNKPLVCTYYGAKVDIFDMSHKVRIIEAQTGKVLKEESFELDRRTERCASTVTGSHYQGAEYGPKVLSMLLPLEPAGVALPKIEVWNYDAVCSGSPMPQAAPYKAGAAGKRGVRTVYFELAEQSFSNEDLPDGFTSADPEADPAKYELVACVTGKPQKKKAECPFIGGNVLELHDGEFEVALYEAATAKLVEKKSFKGSSSGCPGSHKFFGARDKVMTRIEPAFADYIKKLRGG
jgi:hypothetical protein